MEKENKYYTPELSEFCVGFECEFKDLSGNFVPMVHTKESIGFADTFRVKYLNEQDIIDCGFEVSEDWSFKGSKGFIKTEEDSLGDLREKYITSLMDDNIVTILEYSEFTRLPNTIFRGTIKNKTEFKKLLKQIGVYERIN